jgi:hypothetical protein
VRWFVAIGVGVVLSTPVLVYGLINLVSPATTLRRQIAATDRAALGDPRRAAGEAVQHWLGIAQAADPVNDLQVLRRVRRLGLAEIAASLLLASFVAAVIATL